MEPTTAVYQHLLKNGDQPHSLRSRKAHAHAQEAVSAPAARLPVGVRRLDDLLGGGLPQASSALLYGPPFCGKGNIQRKFFVEGLKAKEPSIYLLTDTSASEMSRVLATYEPDLKKLEAKSACAYIDVYTRLIGGQDRHDRAHYVDKTQRWEDVLRVVEKVHNEMSRKNPGPSRLVIESISSLMVEMGPSDTFRFLRALLGRFTRRGGTVLLAIENGMHESHEVQAIKHLCRGMISMRENNDQFYLRVEGLPTEFQPGWVEYEFDERRFDLTGSFASGRIRGGAQAATTMLPFPLGQ